MQNAEKTEKMGEKTNNKGTKRNVETKEGASQEIITIMETTQETIEKQSQKEVNEILGRDFNARIGRKGGLKDRNKVDKIMKRKRMESIKRKHGPLVTSLRRSKRYSRRRVDRNEDVDERKHREYKKEWRENKQRSSKEIWNFATVCLKILDSDPIKNCVNYVINNAFRQHETLGFMKMHDDMNLLDVVINPYFVIDVNKAVVKPTTYRQFQKNFVVHIKSGSLGPFFSYMEGSILWDRLNVPNTKCVIITPQKYLDELFLRSWHMGITNLVVIQYSCDTKNCTTRVITANPQDHDNDCARKFVTSKIEICSSNTTITFPKILRKFTNCNVLLMDSPSKLSFLLKRKMVYFLLETVTDFLNTSFRFTMNFYPYDQFFFKEVAFGLNSYLPRSSVVFRDDTIFVVPTPKKISRMEILKIVFKTNVWIAIVVTYILITIIWYVFLKYFTNEVGDLSSTFLSMWSITLFGSINQTPRTLPLKLIFIVYVVYSVHIQTAFVSNLVDILTVTKYEKGITNVEELAVSNIPIYVQNSTLYHNYFLDQKDASSTFNKIKQKIIFLNNMLDLPIKIFFNNFSFIDQRNMVEMIQITLNKTLTKFVDNSLIGEYKTVLITGYGSYFVNSLNEVIILIEESGLLDHVLKGIDRFQNSNCVTRF
ncbi:hypothetical protein FQR65_LT08922 [Abscondita terminalis]|nr:hypothetical protein FQR65_LT08922 [Abscondita terminalis]